MRKFGKFSGHFDGERGQCSLINETNKQTRQTKKIQYLAGKCTGTRKYNARRRRRHILCDLDSFYNESSLLNTINAIHFVSL